MNQDLFDGYGVLHSIRLDSYTHVVTQNITSEDDNYRIYKVNSGNLVGIANCALVHEHHDYLNVMREFVRQLGAGLDVLGLDRMYRGSLDFDDPPLKTIDCFTDSSKLNLEGQVIAVKAGVLHPEYRSASHQLHVATGGFGCSPNARGRTVYCKNIYDSEDVRFHRGDIIGVVRPESIPTWVTEKLEKLADKKTPQQQSKTMPPNENTAKTADKPSVMDELKQSQKDAVERPSKPKGALTRKKSDAEL